MRTRPLGTGVSIRALSARPRENIETIFENRRKRGQRGIYAWYADAKGREVLRQAKLDVRDDGLVYIGMTTRSFRKRTRGHVKSRRSGNLCETLNGVLGALEPKPFGGDVEKFMRGHFTVAVIPIRMRRRRSSEQELRKEEHELIRDAEKEEPGLLNRRPSTRNGKRVGELCERAGMVGVAGQVASVSAQDRAEDKVPPPSRKLSRRGRFRRDFWAHVGGRHRGDAPPGWAGGNVYHRPDEDGRSLSMYVARDGVGVFFARERGESAAARTAAVASIVRRLRAEIEDPRMADSGWSFLKINSRDRRNWDCMADWLHKRRVLYGRALRNAERA